MSLANSETLADALLAIKQSALKDNSVTFIEGDESEIVVSYAELYDRALIILNHLQARGVGAGCELLICTSTSQQFLDAFWACQLGGITAVPVAVSYSQQGREKLFSVFDTLQDGFIFSNRKTLEGYESFAIEQGGDYPGRFSSMTERYIAANELGGIVKATELHRARPTDVAMIQFSSGTTGNPKGVVLTHQNLLANIRGIVEACQISQSDSLLSWMPLTHDMGLIGFHLVPLVLGLNHYLIPTTAFARRPLLWLNKASAHKATLLASPNFGYQHYLKAYRSKRPSDLDLSSVRLIFNGAEPISASVCDEFCSNMEPFGLSKHAMFPVYGLAEASLAVSFTDVAAPLHIRNVDRHALKPGDHVKDVLVDDPNCRSLVSVGQAVPGCEFRIAQNGSRLSSGLVGQIEIRGANVSTRYYGSGVVRSSEDWLDTGDLGFSDDALYIVGRSKDTILINGAGFHAVDLEEVCIDSGLAERGKLACVSVVEESGEQLVVFIASRGDLEVFAQLVARVKKVFNEKISINPYQVLPVQSLPKTSSGKLQRQSLSAAYANGEFAEVQQKLEAVSVSSQDHIKSSARSEIEQTLLDICREVITTSDVGVSDDLFELGASSLALAEICEEMNGSFPGRLDLADFLEYTSVEALAAYLEKAPE